MKIPPRGYLERVRLSVPAILAVRDDELAKFASATRIQTFLIDTEWLWSWRLVYRGG
jgi:hypothetical protein